MCDRLKKLYLYGVTSVRSIDELRGVNPDVWIEIGGNDGPLESNTRCVATKYVKDF